MVAPSSTGSRSWTGLGFTSEGAIRYQRPWYSTGSGPQQARMAATTSSMPAPIRSMGTFAVSNSCGIHPWPTPAIARPPLSWSRVAKRRASTTGGCSRASITLVPSLTRSVRAATELRVSSGS